MAQVGAVSSPWVLSLVKLDLSMASKIGCRDIFVLGTDVKAPLGVADDVGLGVDGHGDATEEDASVDGGRRPPKSERTVLYPT
jgi:hypothetical protein